MKKQLLLLVTIVLPLVASADESGSCGNNVKWKYVTATKTLTIYGTGAMTNYSSSSSAPWYSLRNIIQKVVVEDGVTTIGNYAFYNNYTKITKLTIANSITSIGSDAFRSCSGLTSLVIPNSVTTIGQAAFQNCTGLYSLVIGSGVTSISNSAFSSLTNLRKTIWLCTTPPTGYAKVNGSVHYVPNDQFTSLKNTTIYPYLGSMFEVDGIRYVSVSPSERTCDAIDCVYDETAENTKIPASVTHNGIAMTVKKVQPYVCYHNQNIKYLTCEMDANISDYAFYFCTSMQNVTLGDKVTGIGNYAFQNVNSLESIVIPNNVTIIGKYAFAECVALGSVTIGSKVNSIGDYAFRKCTSLTKLSIPKSVMSIGNCSFLTCSGLKEIIIEDREEELALGYNKQEGTVISTGEYNDARPLFSNCPLETVYIGGNISYDTSVDSGYSPFCTNTTLKSVVIADGETEITEREFYGCTSLESITIGNDVTTFGANAFSDCSSLKTLVFGSQLQTIGQQTFSGCSSMAEITSKTKIPPVCGTNALQDVPKWTCKLYVPCGCQSAYQSASQWSEFYFINELDPEPDVLRCATPTITIVDGKLSFSSETEGVMFKVRYNYVGANEEVESDELVLAGTTTAHVTVYATKEGYLDSETAAADVELCIGKKGDVNADGVVSITDAVGVVNIILNNGATSAPAMEVPDAEPVEATEPD